MSATWFRGGKVAKSQRPATFSKLIGPQFPFIRWPVFFVVVVRVCVSFAKPTRRDAQLRHKSRTAPAVIQTSRVDARTHPHAVWLLGVGIVPSTSLDTQSRDFCSKIIKETFRCRWRWRVHCLSPRDVATLRLIMFDKGEMANGRAPFFRPLPWPNFN